MSSPFIEVDEIEIEDLQQLPFCSVCGGCNTPEKCPAAYQCPTCLAPRFEVCREGDEPYHAERVEYARTNR